jgi:hypothetical protein
MNKHLDPARESPPEATADAPNEGALVMTVDGDQSEQVVLTNALHWQEDGEHIISSTEFQVASSGETFADAYLQMVDNLLQEALSLGKLIEDAEAAPNEREEALALFTRFQQMIAMEERAQRRQEEEEAARLAKHRRRRRKRAVHATRSRQWQIRSSAHRHSGSPLPA